MYTCDAVFSVNTKESASDDDEYDRTTTWYQRFLNFRPENYPPELAAVAKKVTNSTFAALHVRTQDILTFGSVNCSLGTMGVRARVCVYVCVCMCVCVCVCVL